MPPTRSRLIDMPQGAVSCARSRRSMRSAMARSHEAMSIAHRGQALLTEAQQQLERALGIVVGQASHYSGQIAGQYQLGTVIGIDAMGEVYAAEHVDTAQPAAVKLMRPSALSRADIPLCDFALGTPSLDDVFFTLTGRPPAKEPAPEAAEASP